jgi:hypothetical protein
VTRHEQLAVSFLAAMVVCTAAIALWTRRVFRKDTATLRVQLSARRGQRLFGSHSSLHPSSERQQYWRVSGPKRIAMEWRYPLHRRHELGR